MKKMMTFLTIALTTLVAFVSCANPTYSDKMIDVESVEVAFDIDESDGSWTAKKGYGAELSLKDTALVIKSESGWNQVAIKIDNPGATQVVVEYGSTGPVTFGFLTKTAQPWDGRIAGADVYADVPGRRLEQVLTIPDGAGYLTIGSNGDATNKITVKSIIVE
jgi:hypothetical protein